MTKTSKLFIYGSLQPEGNNYYLLQSCITEPPKQALAHDLVLYISPRLGFPIGYPTKLRSVEGYVATVDMANRAYRQLVQMEVSFGYVPHLVTTELIQELSDPGKALTFVIPDMETVLYWTKGKHKLSHRWPG